MNKVFWLAAAIKKENQDPVFRMGKAFQVRLFARPRHVFVILGYTISDNI